MKLQYHAINNLSLSAGKWFIKIIFLSKNTDTTMIMRRRLACCTRDMRDMSIDFDEQESNILSRIYKYFIFFMKKNNDADRFCDAQMPPK